MKRFNLSPSIHRKERSPILLYFLLSLMFGFLASFLTFPCLRYSRMYNDALRCSSSEPLKRFLVHVGFFSPLFVLVLWIKPLAHDHLVHGEKAIFTLPQFESFRLWACLVVVLTRFLLANVHLQAYLNMAHDKVNDLRNEGGRITNIDLQKMIAQIFYYLCVVSIQYFAPFILILSLTFILKILAVAADSKTKEEASTLTAGKRVTVDWSYNTGEPVIQIVVIDIAPAPLSILALGERTIFCLSECGVLRFAEKLEYTPICLLGYAATYEGYVQYLVATQTQTLLLYVDTTLRWAAQMPRMPVCLDVLHESPLRGILVSVSDDGRLDWSYLGTDPAFYGIPNPEAVHLAYDSEIEESIPSLTMRNLEKMRTKRASISESSDIIRVSLAFQCLLRTNWEELTESAIHKTLNLMTGNLKESKIGQQNSIADLEPPRAIDIASLKKKILLLSDKIVQTGKLPFLSVKSTSSSLQPVPENNVDQGSIDKPILNVAESTQKHIGPTQIDTIKKESDTSKGFGAEKNPSALKKIELGSRLLDDIQEEYSDLESVNEPSKVVQNLESYSADEIQRQGEETVDL
uniref:PTHB1 N-terminal domain-containing protein n=1 Tax=Romanomermis culicivorax TaxID=13658 RepID=A0A915JJ24_ROMCU